MRAHRIAWLALLLAGTLQAQLAPEQRRSDVEALHPDLRAMQRDDARNPAMLWVQQGAQLWQQPAGAQQRACASCHGEVQRLRGVAAHYPAFDASSGGALNLAQRIQRCRTQQQQAAPWPLDSEDLLALEALVALQSRGLPLNPPADPRLQPVREHGRQLYVQRLGQLNLSCAQCHDERAGQRLGGSLIPQGHVDDYPVFRLEWQSLGSLQRRLRGCFSGVRAEVPPFDHADLVALELHLMQRAAGMPMETPAVRP